MFANIQIIKNFKLSLVENIKLIFYKKIFKKANFD